MKGMCGGMKTLIWAALALALAACANMGRPEGGPRDETPPRFLRAEPMPGSTGVNQKKITLHFDENVQLEDAFNKVVVSPVPKDAPAVSANGRKVTVEFRDTLEPNTTYTVDFADAIKDLNEGNILDGFAMDFSTGENIDSLRISGIVLQAENLEPAQGMLVGVYSEYSDTTLTKVPLERIARTNQYGHFTIRNLKPGAYKLFAINDVNRDYHWDISEDIAFYDEPIVPSVEDFVVSDTLFSSKGTDSTATRPGVRFLPNDVLLTWFNVNKKVPYVADNLRPERRRIAINFGAQNDTMPRLTIAGGAPGIGRADSEWALRQTNATADSLIYWITDPDVLAADSLQLAVHYMKPDSLDRPVWTADTLRFYYSDPKPAKKSDKDTADVAEPEFVSIKTIGGTTQHLNRPFVFETTLPLQAIDTAGIHLEQRVDTMWAEVRQYTMTADSANLLLRKRIDSPWQPGEKYRIRIDSLALTSVYGPGNRPFDIEFTVKNIEDYSTLLFRMPGIDSIAGLVQLLNSSDAPVYSTYKPAGVSDVKISYIDPGTYYARFIDDRNGNGRWDTGDPNISLQPEDVYYYPAKLVLRRNWDIEQTWDIAGTAVDAQKPNDIKKNKPKLKRGEKEPEHEEDDEDIYDENYNPFDRTGRNNRRNNTGSGFGGGRTRSNSLSTY